MILKWMTGNGKVEWGLARTMAESNEMSALIKQRGGQDIARFVTNQWGELKRLPETLEETIANTAVARPAPPVIPEAVKITPGSAPVPEPKKRAPRPAKRRMGCTKRLKEMKDVDSGEWYKAMSPLSLARRLYGSTAEVKLEHSPAHQPAYRIWMVVKKGAILGRIYEPIYEFENEEAEE